MCRKANLDDCEQIFDLICDMEAKKLPFDPFKKIFLNQLQSENYYCLIKCQDNRVIGVLNMRFEEQLHHTKRIAEIMEFAVHSSLRNQGIGKYMFEQACKIAKSYECSLIEVASNQVRKNAHRFYLREGLINSHFKFSKSLQSKSETENLM